MKELSLKSLANKTLKDEK